MLTSVDDLFMFIVEISLKLTAIIQSLRGATNQIEFGQR